MVRAIIVDNFLLQETYQEKRW